MLNVTDHNVSDLPHTLSYSLAFRNDCITVRFSEMAYLPWDNPDNLISKEVETMVHKIQVNILIILFFIGVPANIINMAVFYKQGLKDRVNLCLFVLSMSDGLFLITFMCVYGEQMHVQFTTREKYGPMTRFMINNNLFAFAACGYVSTVLSAVIALERCLCVYRPLVFQRLLRTRTMAIFIVLLYVLVLGPFFFVIFRYRVKCLFDPTMGVVVTTFVEGEFYRAHKKYIDLLDSIIYGAGLPGTVLLTVSITTILTIVKLRKIVTWRSDASTSISPREIALTKMLVANSILFIICFSPDALNHFSRMFVKDLNSEGRYHNIYLTILWIGDIFTFFNGTLNIFVYYTMGSRYRETFWALFGRKSKAESA